MYHISRGLFTVAVILFLHSALEHVTLVCFHSTCKTTLDIRDAKLQMPGAVLPRKTSHPHIEWQDIMRILINRILRDTSVIFARLWLPEYGCTDSVVPNVRYSYQEIKNESLLNQ